jgi:hypothetical protein
MLSLLRRRTAALFIISVLVAVTLAIPTWCAVTGTWGW